MVLDKIGFSRGKKKCLEYYWKNLQKFWNFNRLGCKKKYGFLSLVNICLKLAGGKLINSIHWNYQTFSCVMWWQVCVPFYYTHPFIIHCRNAILAIALTFQTIFCFKSFKIGSQCIHFTKINFYTWLLV